MKKTTLLVAAAVLSSCQDTSNVEQDSNTHAEYGIERGDDKVTYVWLDQYPIVGLVAGGVTFATCWYFADGKKGVNYDMKELFLSSAKPANPNFINVSKLKVKLDTDIEYAKQNGDRSRKGELQAIRHQVFGVGGTHDRESLKLLTGNIHEIKEFGKGIQISSSLDKITWFKDYLKSHKAQPLGGNIVTPLGELLGNKHLVKCPTSRADKAQLRAGYQNDID